MRSFAPNTRLGRIIGAAKTVATAAPDLRRNDRREDLFID
jgi:hypothetical protein